jgi:NAD(P)-dependent dehydrogenase (short-subunit alcohol dehydrogenase family)
LANDTVGADARAIELDVTDQHSIATAAERIRNELGRLDVLVNNAGVSHVGRPGRSLQEIAKSGRPTVASLDEVRTVFETNVFGVIAVTQAMLPLLRESRAARIVNVSSSSGSLTMNSDPANPHRAMFGNLFMVEDGAQRDHRRLRVGPRIRRHQSQCCVPGLHRDGPQ